MQWRDHKRSKCVQRTWENYSSEDSTKLDQARYLFLELEDSYVFSWWCLYGAAFCLHREANAAGLFKYLELKFGHQLAKEYLDLLADFYLSFLKKL